MIQHVNAGTYCAGQLREVAQHVTVFQFRTLRKRIEVDFIATLQHREHRAIDFAVIFVMKCRNFDDLHHVGQLIRFENQSPQNGSFKLGRFRKSLNGRRAVISLDRFASFHG